MHNKKAYYKDRVLTYDYDKSQGMIVPIYTDVDGQLYMPLSGRFVTVNEVIEALESHQAKYSIAI